MSGILVQVAYCHKCTVYRELVERIQDVGESSTDKFDRILQQVTAPLAIGSWSGYSTLRLRGSAIQLATRQPTMPRLTLIDRVNGNTRVRLARLSGGVMTYALSDFQELVVKLTIEAEDLVRAALLGCVDELVALAPFKDAAAQDNAGNLTIGHGLFSRAAKIQQPLLVNLLKGCVPELGLSRQSDVCRKFQDHYLDLDSNKELRLSLPRLRNLVRLVKRVDKILLTLAHLTAGMPTRAASSARLGAANTTELQRGVFAYDGCIVLITNYDKSETLSAVARVSMRVLPPHISQIFWAVHSVLRPMAVYD
ncbi:hypothetical protein P7C70_g9491, partial [Phenoliferia sp. Uapishka_3]